MGISFGSINTGLPKDIVQQIINAEKIPIEKLENRKGKVEAKQELLGELIKRMESLRGTIYANKGERSFRELEHKISDESVMTLNLDKNIATPGTYQIEVMQLAQKSSAISNGVEDKDKTYIGVGYLQYELPNGEVKDVYIDEEHSSLSGLAKLINQNPENGMRATVVNSGDDSDEPWKILITLNETGDDNKASFPNLYLIDGDIDIWFDAEREAQDAKIKLDGFELEVPGNKITDVIPGVTIDLKKAKPGDEVTVEITENITKMSEKIADMVTSVNEVIKFIKEQNALDEKTDTSRTLGGDITLQTIESKIRSTIFSQIETDWGPKRIGDLGLTFQRNGLLELDADKLQAELEKNYPQTVQIIVGKYSDGGKIPGFVDNLDQLASTALQKPGGTLSSRKEGLKSQITQIDRQIEQKQRQISKKEEVLKQKFARLEETISRIKTQGSGLAGMGGGFNPVSQLG